MSESENELSITYGETEEIVSMSVEESIQVIIKKAEQILDAFSEFVSQDYNTLTESFLDTKGGPDGNQKLHSDLTHCFQTELGKCLLLLSSIKKNVSSSRNRLENLRAVAWGIFVLAETRYKIMVAFSNALHNDLDILEGASLQFQHLVARVLEANGIEFEYFDNLPLTLTEGNRFPYKGHGWTYIKKKRRNQARLWEK